MAAIPEHYQDDRMVALVRDPSNIFVYWDLENGGRRKLVEQLGREAVEKGKWVLRLTNLDNGAVGESPIGIEARNWYCGVKPGCRYQAEIGLVDAGGQFYRALSSGPVKMPPLSYSHLYDKQWMILEEDYLKLLALGWQGFVGSSSSSGFLPASTAETAWITVVPESEATQSAPTSPGVPEYKGRK